ncbi:MAG: glycine cleavage system protein GcvH [Gemmatimonadetes bacterium]|jgi:glycine cleavage system H protein|nr:glycine cleavage system protein GcvH [Gemmatimonadota bacterium]MCZ6825452.1 glycine cleavage system protein GcvH [Gemmatimonadota bacterium]
MSEIPESLKYSEEHEYIGPTDADDEVIIGITDYAQGELGDVVYVELPAPGDTFHRMDVFGTIEAVKAVSELYSPVSGEVLAVNEAIDEDPALVNSDPYGAGWMVRFKVENASELEELLSADAYRLLIEE